MSGLFENARVLVTGGAGFVGSNLVRQIIKEGARPVILDDFFTGSLQNLAGVEGQFDLIQGSVVDKDLVMSAVSKADYVFHLAARNIIASTKNPHEDFMTNIGGTLNVLLAAREYRTHNVVYSSSASVYGNPHYLPINEDDHINLLTPYAVSKYGGEGYCRAFYESYGVNVVVVRYSNVFGIGQSPSNPYCGVVAKFMDKINSGYAPEIHGDGQQTRDFTYVQDAIDATIMAALSPKAIGETFNIGSNVETSINTLVDLLLNTCGAELEPIYIDRRDIDNIRRRVVNTEKIRRMLRWTPRVTLKQGLQLTWSWFKQDLIKKRTSSTSV